MSKWTILHNPKCSKSRECLKMLEDSGQIFEVREYLKEPLNQNELEALIQKLQGPLAQIVRIKEEEYKATPFNLENLNEVTAAIAQTPKLMERPIVFNATQAAIGRPLENIQKLLS